MTPRLYVGSVKSCSLASYIAYEESGGAYEARRLDMTKAEQRGPDYLKINPKGRVPALVTERGVLTETPAILFYIAQTNPKAKLAPLGDPFALAELQAFNAWLCSTVHPAHAHGLRGARWSDDPAVVEALKIKVPHNMAECFGLIENGYFKGPWVMGETYTVADPYLYIHTIWLKDDGVDPARFPKVHGHMTRMAARPATQKVMAALAA